MQAQPRSAKPTYYPSVTRNGCGHDTLEWTLTASRKCASAARVLPESREGYAINPSFVWITARDGSIHATRPPLIADGQAMLCGTSYDRRDLRIRGQAAAGLAPAGACTACGELVAAAVGEPKSPARTDSERKAPLWP